MQNKPKSITFDIDDSSQITIGTVHSDASTAFKLTKVSGFHVNEVFHFVKSNKEINQIFDIIQKNIEFIQIEFELKEQAKKLSTDVRDAYISKDAEKFRNTYQQLTGFLSNHITILGPFYPIIIQLLSQVVA